MSFKELHYQAQPLLLCNIWDVASAQIAEQAGFKAIATSSAAIAKSRGYADGQELSFAELLKLVSSIKANTQLPLSVDLEAGYADSADNIIEHIRQLAELGIVGINIEDSEVKQSRQLVDGQVFAEKLAQIVNYLKSPQIEFFINARTDPYLVEHPTPLEETIARAKLYQQAGVDGIFAPGMTEETEIKQLTAEIDIPVNLLALANLPAMDRLTELGIKRVSMGNFLYERSLQLISGSMIKMIQQQSVEELFSEM